jgi:branched-chain amino acid transport system permease protein
MAGVVQHVVSGLAAGGIYALLALALVLIHRATGVVNFAQGATATLSAYVCWTLTAHGWAFWPAFATTVALAFAGGAGLRSVVLKPLQDGPVVAIMVLTVGLLIAIDGLDPWIWGGGTKRFHGPFSAAPVHLAGIALPKRDVGVIGVALVSAAVVAALLHRTKLGLGLRAAAANPLEARLAGVRVGEMLAITWGLAAALSAVAGVLAAPSFVLAPHMMQSGLLYAFAAAILGGLDSPLGAVVGGLVVGVGLALLGTYIHWIDGELRLATALALILGVLLVCPTGVFGRRAADPA